MFSQRNGGVMDVYQSSINIESECNGICPHLVLSMQVLISCTAISSTCIPAGYSALFALL